MASESIIDTAQSMSQAVELAREVIVQKENFKKFSSLLDRTTLVLRELSKFEVKNSDLVNKALENLEVEIKIAKQLAIECSKGNKVYLLLSCKRIVENLDTSSKNISQAVGLFSLGSLEVSLETNERLIKLRKDMEDAKYQVYVMEEEILQKIEMGLHDRNTDRSYATDLLIRISESVGISSEQSELKKEFEDFKREMQRIESATEASRMEQIVLLLGNADIVTTPEEKEMKYLTKRDSLGRDLFEPLQSFYCPITADIMVDPVETSAGHTYEREAIEKWLEEGNNFCPMTKTPLSRLSLRPNRTLRQSIEEWRNRNIMITIASMKPELKSGEEQEVLHSLRKLHDLCIRSELHRGWIVMEDYISIITGFLSAKNCEIRVHALTILYRLAKDGDDNKEDIANVNDSITHIVRSLARKVEESMLALQLLLELSRSICARNLIGRVQGCILLLVTLANSDDAQASRHALEILDNLAFLDENVVRMAWTKFFKPLLHRLSEGPVDVQMMMAETLGDLELTDHNKLCLSREGALKPLLEMMKNCDIEVKAMAVKALENLSTVAANGLQLIKQGAKTPLFDLLFCHSLSSSKLRQQVAKTIRNLAISTTSPEASDEQILLLETQDDIFKLFSLVSYTAPDTQQTLLQTFHALCKSHFGFNIRRDLRQMCAVKVLVQLCELNDDLPVRASAVKLLYYLTEDGDDPTFTEHVNKKCLTCLVDIIKTSSNEDEKSAAMGIISLLPHNSDMSQNLVQSGALDVINACLKFRNEKKLIENAADALCRFTASSNLECQKKVAEAGMIPVLVELLSSGTPLTKRNVAISLKQLSENSNNLIIPVKTSYFLRCCFASAENMCPVHMGICSIESTFCLLEANAVKPLVAVLGEDDADVCEASLDAILTLINGLNLQNGCKVLEEGGAIPPMIKMLNSPCSNLQEKTLGALQRIFRLVEFKTRYGKSAQMSLVDITQRGSSNAKSLAAKILAQLNVLNEQSSFFDGNV